MPTPCSSCTCPIAILATLLLLKPAKCTEFFHKLVTILLCSTTVCCNWLSFPHASVLSYSFSMIQRHPSTFLLFSPKKSWKCEGHSSICYSGKWDLVVLNIHSYHLSCLWRKAEMELQSSAILHNLPFYSYFLISLLPFATSHISPHRFW